MKYLRYKINYFLIGFDFKKTAKSLLRKLFCSKLLYFYLIIGIFVLHRGLIPMKKLESSIAVTEHSVIKPETGGLSGLAAFIGNFPFWKGSIDGTNGCAQSSQKNEDATSNGLKEKADTEIRAYGNTEGRGYTIAEFNALSEKELTIFYGVGEKTAEAIVKLREQRGGFKSFTELLDVKGIGEKKLKRIMGEENETDRTDK